MWRSAIRKDAGLCCGSRLRKGEVLAYAGLSRNLKDLKARKHPGTPTCEQSHDAANRGEIMPNLPGRARDTGDVSSQMYTAWRRGEGEKGRERD